MPSMAPKAGRVSTLQNRYGALAETKTSSNSSHAGLSLVCGHDPQLTNGYVALPGDHVGDAIGDVLRL